MKLLYDEITRNNLDIALKIQNRIFPTEDARRVYEASIYGNDSFSYMKYYIVYEDIICDENIVGVSGEYVYKEYPKDLWLGYYGVVEDKRGNGIGAEILKNFEQKAKEMGFEHIRLYTNKVLFPLGYKAFEKAGFNGEKYTNFPKKMDNAIMENEYVYSKNLNNKEVQKWNNKLIIDFIMFH